MAAEADWLRLQKKIFGRYVQQRLREAGIKREIVSIVDEMKDGTLLIQLMQVMSASDFATVMNEKKGIPEPSTMRIKQIENAGKAIKFVEACGCDLKKIRIQAEDMVDCKEKVVLAMVFQIIIKYLKIEDEDGGNNSNVDIRDALKLWLKNKTAGYNGIEIENFGKSFHNGLIFNALIHKMRPKLLNFNSLSAGNADKNLQQALDLGEAYMGVEKYVTVQDIPKLDELSMIVYLSDWYFGVSLLQKQDVAARRIGKLVDLTILHDGMRAAYKEQATGINQWCTAKIQQLSQREFDDTLGGIRRLLENFYAYKKGERSNAVINQMESNALFMNLAQRLKNHKRPAFAPGPGLTIAEIEQLFVKLEQTESARVTDMYKELARQLRLQKLAARFRANATKLQAWIQQKQAYLNAGESIDSVEDAEECLDVLKLYDGEFAQYSSAQLADENALVQELAAERYEETRDVQGVMQGLSGSFQQLQQMAGAKRQNLQGQLQQQKDLNAKLFANFAKSQGNFSNWLKQQKDALGSTSGDLEAQYARVCGCLQQDPQQANQLLGDLAQHDQAVLARNLYNNPHTNVTLDDCSSSFAQYEVMLQKKKDLLEEQIENSKRAGLTPDQMKEIDDNFNYFDKDGSRFLNIRELRACLQSLGEESTTADIQRIMSQHDQDKSGTITKDEFQVFMIKQLGDTDTEEEIVKGFKLLSMDADSVKDPQLSNVVNDKSFKDHHFTYLRTNMQGGGGGYLFIPWTASVFQR